MSQITHFQNVIGHHLWYLDNANEPKFEWGDNIERVVLIENTQRSHFWLEM